MSLIYLKVKIKSLAEEARIIRKEEQKQKRHAQRIRDRFAKHTVKTRIDKESGNEFEAKVFSDPLSIENNLKKAQYDAHRQIRFGLAAHREAPVGTESRAALIAYGFARGLQYNQIETPSPKKSLTFGKWMRPVPNGYKEEYRDHTTNRVFTLINKYARQITFEEFEKWILRDLIS
jgi:hypothetical protein